MTSFSAAERDWPPIVANGDVVGYITGPAPAQMHAGCLMPNNNIVDDKIDLFSLSLSLSLQLQPIVDVVRIT